VSLGTGEIHGDRRGHLENSGSWEKLRRSAGLQNAISMTAAEAREEK